MKKYLFVLFAFVIVSCEGPAGPPGPPGPQGPPGPIGQMFERTVSFTADPYYERIIDIPNSIEVYPTDIVVVYLRWTVSSGNQVWQPLPLSVFFKDGGEFQYAFDYTTYNVRLFLKGDINLNTLGPTWTQDQKFRIVVLPAAMSNKVNLKDMEAVMNLVEKGKE